MTAIIGLTILIVPFGALMVAGWLPRGTAMRDDECHRRDQ